jgi:hypothetical protein
MGRRTRCSADAAAVARAGAFGGNAVVVVLCVSVSSRLWSVLDESGQSVASRRVPPAALGGLGDKAAAPWIGLPHEVQDVLVQVAIEVTRPDASLIRSAVVASRVTTSPQH